MHYDFCIVGAGLFGSTFAYQASKDNKKCLVLERRGHIAGNCYDESRDGISMCLYGPHIFHTASKRVWDFITQFSDFNHYRAGTFSRVGDRLFSFPVNLMTLHQLWGVKTPGEAKARLEIECVPIKHPRNFEEMCLSLVGHEIYETFFKGYTEKQWGVPATEVPARIAQRLPYRTTFDNNYFNDAYQGIPVLGYTHIVEELLTNVDLQCKVDFLQAKDYWMRRCNVVIFTGCIDEFFGYYFGELKYRSLKFEHEKLPTQDFQGCAAVHYPCADTPFTRIIEHKHYTFGIQPLSWITREYPDSWERGKDPFYPVSDAVSMDRLRKYQQLAKEHFPNVVFGGRLGSYQYYNMYQVVASALATYEKFKC